MRKIKYLILISFIVCLASTMLSGCGSIAYERLELQHAENVTFAIGNEYRDSTLVVYGVTADGYKRDITADCEIDSSDYNKDVPGGYIIVVKYMDLTAEYTVFVGEAVSKILVEDSKTEYALGENYTSSGLRVYTITTSNGKKEVTSSIKPKDIDYSNFNKDVAGEYTIYVTYLGFTAEYTVTVKEKSQALLKTELEQAMQNTFKRDNNGNFNYEATNTQVTENGETLIENIIFKIDVNNNVEYYAEYTIETVIDNLPTRMYTYIWFNGPYDTDFDSKNPEDLENIGTMTVKTNSDGADVVTSEETHYTITLMYPIMLKSIVGYPITIFPTSFVNELDADSNGESSEPISETYNFTNLGTEGYLVEIVSTYLDDESEEYNETKTYKFKNNKIYDIDGATYKFLTNATSEIPEIPEGTEIEIPEDTGNTYILLDALDVEMKMTVYYRTNDNLEWIKIDELDVEVADDRTQHLIELDAQQYGLDEISDGSYIEFKYEFINYGDKDCSITMEEENVNSILCSDEYKFLETDDYQEISFLYGIETSVSGTETKNVFIKLGVSYGNGNFSGTFKWIIRGQY